MEISIFTGVAGFLLGIVVTIIGYIMPMSNRLTRLETKFDVHIATPVVPCPFHEKFAEKVEKLELNVARGKS